MFLLLKFIIKLFIELIIKLFNLLTPTITILMPISCLIYILLKIFATLIIITLGLSCSNHSQPTLL